MYGHMHVSMWFQMGPASHICVQCGGELLVGVQGVGDANVDYVFLQPGTWGRFQGLEGAV